MLLFFSEIKKQFNLTLENKKKAKQCQKLFKPLSKGIEPQHFRHLPTDISFQLFIIN